MTPNSCAPILVLVWNRPDYVKILLERLALIQPANLFVASDGPRSGNPSDLSLIEESRSLVSELISWPCDVRVRYQSSNLGCKRHVSSAISWFFDHNEFGIILEDDCIPHPDFFPFATQLLSLYSLDTRVWSISADNRQPIASCDSYAESYYFSRYHHCWAWATWERAWSYYNLDNQNFLSIRGPKSLRPFLSFLQSLYWYDVWSSVFKFNSVDTWDYQWTFTCFLNNGLSIIPRRCLVENIGFSANATHTTTGRSPLAPSPRYSESSSLLPLVHPSITRANITKDRYTFYKTYLRPYTLILLFLKYIRRFIKSML